MEPPVTPKPMPTSLPDLPTDHSGKLFGIVYIPLTGVIDTITLAAGLWSWVGKSASYLLKLAPLLWWALPAKNPARVTPENNGQASHDWIPDKSTALPPPAEPSLVRPNSSFYLLSYLVGYYLLGRFSSMMGRFAFLGNFSHLAMVTLPIGLVIAGLNVGALAHQIGNLFPLKWVPDIGRCGGGS
ncbi:hypothetical protein DSO57_1012333 [Entomophthora muscae]|uniref:Uncharacterized protein n=1 Tax=Entomophthora muscae TaxID=34485 RepID=A0ACC2U4A8_9FUNG|nr:hypothetical protein DSO57_1012333 [Entomophthora muscae]